MTRLDVRPGEEGHVGRTVSAGHDLVQCEAEEVEAGLADADPRFARGEAMKDRIVRVLGAMVIAGSIATGLRLPSSD
jgi:hypothetical protein